MVPKFTKIHKETCKIYGFDIHEYITDYIL